MNALGNEYKQIGGDYQVMHHTQYLETLITGGQLQAGQSKQSITYHDPCYLGRHNGVYDAPRNLLRVLGSEVLELERNRSNAFCCGAGGAQFWKEEEPGDERISENRFKEVQRVLGKAASEEKTLAVGCPFCKSMLGSTPSRDGEESIAIKDVAELLLEGVNRAKGISATAASPGATIAPSVPAVIAETISVTEPVIVADEPIAPTLAPEVTQVRKKWQPKQPVPEPQPAQAPQPEAALPAAAPAPEHRKWQPKSTAPAAPAGEVAASAVESTAAQSESDKAPDPPLVELKKWQPKSKS